MATAKKSFPLWAIVLGILVLLGFWLMSSYNGLVSAQQNMNNEWAQVQTEYQRRFDLIPNLQNIVKGAAEFEQSTLTAVTQARTQWMDTQSDPTATTEEQMAAEQNLDSALARLIVTVESYPTLTATEEFKTFQIELEGTENRVAVARQDYNDATTSYNLKVKTFPSKLSAILFGFEEAPLFAADTGAEDAPSVNFDFDSTPTTQP